MRIGIDLGGTKIESIALGAQGEVLARERIPTPQGDYPSTLRSIVDLVHKMETTVGQQGTVGVGTPGALSATTGLLKNSNSVCLNGRAIDVDLATLLERPVRVANDANCFALSEAVDGAAAGMEVVFGVIIGTGTGGGIVVKGHVLAGVNRIAGEWGHNPLPWPRDDERPGPECYCGKRGCIETFLSGPGLCAYFLSATGQAATAEHIAQQAQAGERNAVAALVVYEDRLARALASVINVLDPDVVVLGGGLSNITPLYTSVPQRWQHYVFSDSVRTRLVKARHGDSSGVRGAAWLWGGPHDDMLDR